jgi:hypothetical protein
MLWPWAFSFGLDRGFVESSLRRIRRDARVLSDLYREKIGADHGFLSFIMMTASKV